MRILQSKYKKPLHLILEKEEALLLLKKSDNTFECVYINKGATDLEEGLNKLKNIISFKFLGSKVIFTKLSKLNFNWLNICENKIITIEKISFFYLPKKGIIRFENKRIAKKSSINTIKNKTVQIVDNSKIVKKKKVLIVDDSKTIQKLLTKIIKSSDKLEILAVTGAPSEAKSVIEKTRPDIITLDIHMPEMNGVEFLKTYLKDKNIPVIMISSVNINEGKLVMEALNNGAQSYIQKPSLKEMASLAPKILDELENISFVNPSANCEKNNNTKNIRKVVKNLKGSNKNIAKSSFKNLTGLVLIGSSTGGVQALEKVLTSLPTNIPPIIITQHIPAVFSKALADRLNTLCSFNVSEAVNGELVKENNVFIAPGNKQIKILACKEGIKIEVNDDDPVGHFKPSVDYTFDSVNKLKIKNLVAVILTGMGKDGSKSMLKLKQNGAKTIAQDEQSSVVFGMPKRAIELGAVDIISPLDEIGQNIINLHNKKRSAA